MSTSEIMFIWGASGYDSGSDEEHIRKRWVLKEFIKQTDVSLKYENRKRELHSHASNTQILDRFR